MVEKQRIINEYLLGGSSFRQLSKKHGVSRATVHRWVSDFEGKARSSSRTLKVVDSKVMELSSKKELEVDLSAENKLLKEELNQAQLLSKLYLKMIEIAEDDLKIPIRKKYGTKQSKK